MTPRAIEVHIEELVLHGFEPAARTGIAAALESSLSAHLAGHGIPAAWRANPERIDAGPVRLNPRAQPASTGQQIATAVHAGGKR